MRKFLFVVAIVLAILAGVDAAKKAGRPPKPSPVAQARDVRTDWAGVRMVLDDAEKDEEAAKGPIKILLLRILKTPVEVLDEYFAQYEFVELVNHLHLTEPARQTLGNSPLDGAALVDLVRVELERLGAIEVRPARAAANGPTYVEDHTEAEEEDDEEIIAPVSAPPPPSKSGAFASTGAARRGPAIAALQDSQGWHPQAPPLAQFPPMVQARHSNGSHWPDSHSQMQQLQQHILTLTQQMQTLGQRVQEMTTHQRRGASDHDSFVTASSASSDSTGPLGGDSLEELAEFVAWTRRSMADGAANWMSRYVSSHGGTVHFEARRLAAHIDSLLEILDLLVVDSDMRLKLLKVLRKMFYELHAHSLMLTDKQQATAALQTLDRASNELLPYHALKGLAQHMRLVTGWSIGKSKPTTNKKDPKGGNGDQGGAGGNGANNGDKGGNNRRDRGNGGGNAGAANAAALSA
jgi:hypothetical protein